MLILSREIGESIVIDGRITVRVLRLDGGAVKLGIDAPPEVAVHRHEVYEEIQHTNRQALVSNRLQVPELKATITGVTPHS